MRSILVFILIIAVLASCNKGASPAYNDRPVVTTYLMADTTPSVTISRQVGTSSSVANSTDDITALKVYLTDSNSNNTYPLTHVDSGSYTAAMLKILAGHTYQLSFLYNGKTVTSSTIIPSKPQNYIQSVTAVSMQKIVVSTMGGFGINNIDPIVLNWTNTNNSYYLVVVQNIEALPELIRDTSTTGFNPNRSFRTEPSITNTVSICGNELEYFGMHRLLLYHINPEYAALYETSSSSSQDITTPPTNVVNGFGIFTGINADTLYLDVLRK